MSNYKINIPKPCTEDWDKMTQTEKGRHCASCNKVVIDFSNMNDQEIISILLKNRNKKICGNFYNTQIENPIHYIGIKKHTRWPAIAAMLIAGTLQLMPLNSFGQKERTQPLSSSVLNLKGEENKYTEPVKDSSNVYTIKILSKEDKIPVLGASITIENIGTYTTNQNGIISFSVTEDKIPALIKVSVSAGGYEYMTVSIQKNKILKAKQIELWLKKNEKYMLRGDVSIEDYR